MSAIALVALACPSCKSALGDPAAPTAVLFLCPQCATAVEATSVGVAAYPVAFAGGAGSYRLWWRLEAEVAIKKFSASVDTPTPWGTLSSNIVKDKATKLPAVFLIPADEATLKATCAAAVKMGAGQLATGDRSKTSAHPVSAQLSASNAALLARQVFLTHVAKAAGEVHCLDFAIAVKSTSVVARAS